MKEAFNVQLKGNKDMKTWIFVMAVVVVLCGGCARVDSGGKVISSNELAAPAEVPKGFEALRLTKTQAGQINHWLSQHGATPNPAEYARFVQSVLRADQQAEFQKMLTAGSR